MMIASRLYALWKERRRQENREYRRHPVWPVAQSAESRRRALEAAEAKRARRRQRNLTILKRQAMRDWRMQTVAAALAAAKASDFRQLPGWNG